MRYRRLVIGLVVGLLLLHVSAALAVDPPAPPPASALGLIRDMRLTVLARRTLRQQPAIAGVFVEVREGVARVWGTAPSAEAARQVVSRLEAINGVHEVRSELAGTEVPEQQAVVNLSVPARVPSRIVVQAHKPDPELEQLRKKPREVLRTVGGEGAKVVRPGYLPQAPPPPDRPGSGAVLLPPARVKQERKPNESAAFAQPKAPPSLKEAVARVKRSDERFGAIPVEVKDRVIIVGRSGASDEDITALAQELRLLPGVEDVIREE